MMKGAVARDTPGQDAQAKVPEAIANFPLSGGVDTAVKEKQCFGYNLFDSLIQGVTDIGKLKEVHFSNSNVASECECRAKQPLGQDGPRTASGPNTTPTLVREESSFRMFDLEEALDLVECEVRYAMCTKLHDELVSCTHLIKSQICEGLSSQVAQPCRGHVRHMSRGSPQQTCLQKETSAKNHAGTEGKAKKGRKSVLVATEEGLLENIGYPFLGRRIGASRGIIAPVALPPFRASLVDGYAFHIPSGGWKEVQLLYKQSQPHLQLSSIYMGRDSVALKIAGETRASAGVTGETIQPFRGHPHIREYSGSEATKHWSPKFSFQSQARKSVECVIGDRHDGVAPISLQCVYVTTGAPVPIWCNAVLPVESCVVDVDDGFCWPDHEAVSSLLGKGENIRDVGADAPAESPLLQQGQLVGPAEEGLLAAIGVEKLAVFRKLHVHTLALGDELQSRMAPKPAPSAAPIGLVHQHEGKGHLLNSKNGCLPCDNNGHIGGADVEFEADGSPHKFQTMDKSTAHAVYDSNSPMLRALVSQHCPSAQIDQQHVLPDDVDKVRRLLLTLALNTPISAKEPQFDAYPAGAPMKGSERVHHGVDVLISSGGVSMGGSDCMKLALLQLEKDTLQQSRCRQRDEVSREHFDQQPKLEGSVGRRLPKPASFGSEEGTKVSKVDEYTTRGCPIAEHAGGEVTACKSGKVPRANNGGWRTVETTIKFGRLNVKPGKPAIFAVLRVFHHKAGFTARNESDNGPARPLLKHSDGATARQENSATDAFFEPTSRSPADRLLQDAFHGSLSRTNEARNDVEQSSVSSRGPDNLQPTKCLERTLLVFALPGNPCSTWVLFHLLVAPALNFYSSFTPSASLLAHAPAQTLARLDEPIVPDRVRFEYHRALLYVHQPKNSTRLGGCDDGTRSQEGKFCACTASTPSLQALSTGVQTSSRLLSCCASANGLIVVTPTKDSKRTRIAAGDTVPVLLLGPPFPCRPEPLVRLLKLQNKLTGHCLTECKCGGGKDRAVEAHTREIRLPNARATGTQSPEHETSPCGVTSARHPVNASAAHFKESASVDKIVKLGIIVVSDRAYRGDMQDACAKTLLRILRTSDIVTNMLRLNSQHKSLTSAAQEDIFEVRGEDGKFIRSENLCNMPGGQSADFRIVPDEVESIQKAVLSMVCACASGLEEPQPTLEGVDRLRKSLIFVCGGTGLSARDVTPQAVLPLFAVRCNGIEHLLLEYSLNCTPLAALGRPCAGIVHCPVDKVVERIIGSDIDVKGCTSEFTTHTSSVVQATAVNTPVECCSRTVAYSPHTPQESSSIKTERRSGRLGADAFIKPKESKNMAAATCQTTPFDGQALMARRASQSGAARATRSFSAECTNFSRKPVGCGARCMVLVFPGNPKAVRENTEALLPVLPHALELL